MERESYFERKAVSRTLLSEFTRHPKRAKAMLDGVDIREESDAMKFGSLFDSLMFDTAQEFSSKYRVQQYENPWTDGRKNTGKFTAALKGLMDERLAGQHGLTEDEMMQQAYTVAGIKNPKYEDLINDFNEVSGREWMNEYLMSDRFTLITQEEYNKISAMKATLINDDFVGYYFVQDVPETHMIKKDENVDIHYQMDIAFQMEEVECKALLDVVWVDHFAKRLVGIDLKTSSSNDQQFIGGFIKYGYDQQGAWYHLALQHLVQDENSPFYGYSVAPYFLFVFIDVFQNHDPSCVMLSSKDLDDAINGGYRYRKFKKGIKGIFYDYLWHVENNKWDHHKEYYDNGGIILTDIYDNVLEEV